MIFKRQIDVELNLVYIDELECVSMDLSLLPEGLLFYSETGESDWGIEWKDGLDLHGLEGTIELGLSVQKIALKILDEAVLIWEQQRGLKFEPDMHKAYREEIEEIERLANEELESNEEQ